MDEETKTDTPEKPNGPMPPTGAVSRRDFLKRASRDAVQTGVSLMPGAAVANAVLGGTDKSGIKKPSLGERWASWRSDRLAETNIPPAPKADEETKP